MKKEKLKKNNIILEDDVKTDFANWINELPKENPDDKSWSERYEELFRKSNGNNKYLVGQNKDRNWLMRRKTQQEVAGMIKAVEESNSNSRANRREEAREGAELVAQSGRWKVYRIKTPQASAHYGAHTRWCIAGNSIGLDGSRESVSYAREYWTSQTRGYSRVFYYIRNDDNKFALLWDSPDKFQLWDALDNKIMQASNGNITFEAGAINEVKMFCYTVPVNPQTNNFDFKEMFNRVISRGNEVLRRELTSYNRQAEDGQFIDFTDEDFDDPNFNQLVCDTIPTTSNIDILLSRVRRTNAPLIRMKITCNTTNAIRDSLKQSNKIDLYNGGFKLKSENKSFRAVKDRFKKLAEMNSDPNSGLKILSVGYLVSFAPALNFIPYSGNDNAQFVIEDQNQINTLLNNFSRYEDHALYDLFSVGINDVLTNSLRYIKNYCNSHSDLSTNDYNKLLSKLNEYLQYYIRMAVKANRSQLGFVLPTANIPVVDQACIDKIIQSYELPTEEADTLLTVLNDATNTARITRDIQRNVQSIENETNADQVEINQMGGVNTRQVEEQMSIDDLTAENEEIESIESNTPEQNEDLLANESLLNNTVNENLEEDDEENSDTWPNGVPKEILGISISRDQAEHLARLTPQQREDALLFDVVVNRGNGEMTQEEYERIKRGNAALGNSLETLHEKMREYGVTLIEETNQEVANDEYIRNVMTEIKNALDSLSSSYSFGYNVDFDDKFYDVEFDHNSSGFRIQVEEDGNIEILRDTDGRGNLTRIYEYNTRDTSCQEIISEVFSNLYDSSLDEEYDEEEPTLEEYADRVRNIISSELSENERAFVFSNNVFDEEGNVYHFNIYEYYYGYELSLAKIVIYPNYNIKVFKTTMGGTVGSELITFADISDFDSDELEGMLNEIANDYEDHTDEEIEDEENNITPAQNQNLQQSSENTRRIDNDEVERMNRHIMRGIQDHENEYDYEWSQSLHDEYIDYYLEPNNVDNIAYNIMLNKNTGNIEIFVSQNNTLEKIAEYDHETSDLRNYTIRTTDDILKDLFSGPYRQANRVYSLLTGLVNDERLILDYTGNNNGTHKFRVFASIEDKDAGDDHYLFDVIVNQDNSVTIIRKSGLETNFENITAGELSNEFRSAKREREELENNTTQSTNARVPQERYKFLIYGLDRNGQYKILDVTGSDEYLVNNSTDNIANCNAQAIQAANNIYNELKENDFENLGLREVHYMKVINTNGNKLVKIIK